MADTFKYYLINPDTGNYYKAKQETNGAWSITTPSTPTPLDNIPDGWRSLTLEWARHKDYFGTFRSQTIDLVYYKDGAAILYDLFKNTDAGGIEARCILRIDMWQPDFTYHTVYQSEINFANGQYDFVNETFKASTLDSKLFTLLEANASTSYNIPFWVYSGGWITDGFFVWDDGIKLQYNARFITNVPVTDASILNTNSDTGTPTYFSQIPLVYSQTVPYIGNDLLQNQILTGSQDYKNADTLFNNYSHNQYLLKPITIAPTPVPMAATLNINFTQIKYPNPHAGYTTDIYFAIQETNNVDVETNRWAFPNGGGGGGGAGTMSFSNNPAFLDYVGMTVTNPAATIPPITITIKNDHVYSLVWYFVTLSVGGGSAAGTGVQLNYDAFESNLLNNDSSDLRLNPTAVIGFKPFQLLDKIVKCLNSTTTTPNGFPIIPIDTPYSGISSFLFNDAETYDTNPYTTLWTSGNAMRFIAGQQYISVSLADFFKTCFAVYGLGLGIEGDNVRMEPLSYFMDKDTEILNLGTNISNFKCDPLNDYAANHIRSGYKTQYQDFAQYVGTETSFYGLDVFNIQQDYKLPIIRNKMDLDWTAPIVADAYKQELARAASNTNGGSSPSSSNDNYLIETSGTVAALPNVYDPAGNVVGVSAYGLKTYAGIQDTDPTTPPYARGLAFPDTMYNFGLSPARCMWRKAPMVSAICGDLQTKTIAFLKQYWQLYNGNTSIDVSGIASNLSGTLITEVQDITVADLPAPLFMPYMFTFDTTTPLNMYAIINANPYGYITFQWIDQYSGVPRTFKGFIWSVKQKIGDSSAVSFELLAHPDTVL